MDDVDERKIPRAPRGTGSGGRRLWRSVLEELGIELDGHEMLLLEQAVRVVDRLDQMHEELRDSPLTVTNVKGDMVTHPLIVESRQQAIVLSRLMASLRLPTGLQDDDGDELRRPQRRGASRGAYGVRGVVA